MSEAPVPVRCTVPVEQNEAVGGGFRLRLALPRSWPGAEPGQFVMLSPGAVDAVPRVDPLLPRPMAVYREGPGWLDVLYKVTGRGTALLAAAGPGARIALTGPLGRGFPPPEPGHTALLLGGGTGIASLHGLAQRSAAAGKTVVVLGARSAADLLGEADFAALAVELEITTEDGSRGRQGLVTDPLRERLAAGEPVHVFACGPTAMMRAAAELASEHRAPCTVSLENRMACGYGVCLGCAVPLAAPGFALVCRDGPVMRASELDWEGVP